MRSTFTKVSVEVRNDGPYYSIGQSVFFTSLEFFKK
jgi:hypothetical protein